MKKMIRYLASILLVCLLVLGCAACTPTGELDNSSSSDNGKPHLPTEEYPPEEDNDDTPEDTGTLADHVFEAEAAELDESYCMAASQFFDLSFGGNVLMRNNSTYRFSFESDTAYKVNMEVAVSSAFSGGGWVERNLSDMFEVVVNGFVPREETAVPAGDASQQRGGNIYTCVQTVDVPISLVQGRNTIVFYPVDTMYSLDYINIKTSAGISGWEETYPSDGTEISVELPAADAEGRIYFDCAEHGKSNSFVLPALLPNSGYTVSERDGKQWYSFELNGETYSFAADGTYELPEGVMLDEGPAPDPFDPDPSVPNVVDNGKRIFDASAWTTFDNGTEKGALPVKEDGMLKFTDASRFDFFYVAQDTHIADKASNLSGKKDFYGQDYTWKVKMSSTGAFDMLIFATKALPVIFGDLDDEDAVAGGVYLTFDGAKVSVKYENYEEEIDNVVAEGTVKVPLDGTEFEVAITANRLSDNYMRFGIAVNGQKVKFELKNSPEQTKVDAAGNVILYSTNMYGQRLCLVPADGVTIELHNVALPNKDYVEPQGTLPSVPSVVVNGKEFFNLNNWTTFINGDIVGAQPAYVDGALTFTDAARFEFFYVADGVHIADRARNLLTKDFYGQEYTWELDMSANGGFSVLLFANSKFPASEETAMTESDAGRGYLAFADGKLTVNHVEYEYSEKAAEADISDILNGETFTLSITAVRVADLSIKFKIAINGEEVVFTQVGESQQVENANGEMVAITKVADNWIQFNSPEYMYGQRLCIVPQADSSVSIYDLVLPDKA